MDANARRSTVRQEVSGRPEHCQLGAGSNAAMSLHTVALAHLRGEWGVENHRTETIFALFYLLQAIGSR